MHTKFSGKSGERLVWWKNNNEMDFTRVVCESGNWLESFSGQKLFFGFYKDDPKTSADVMRSNSCSSWPIAR